LQKVLIDDKLGRIWKKAVDDKLGRIWKKAVDVLFRYYSGMCWRNRRRPGNLSRIFDVLLASKTADLPNTTVDCCSYSKLFGFLFPLR
jgi:hypothetical protein